jgi:hypothetical protein
MNEFLAQAKKAYWREGCRVTPAFRDTLRALLLEKLAQVGEITDTDRVWVETTVNEMFP